MASCFKTCCRNDKNERDLVNEDSERISIKFEEMSSNGQSEISDCLLDFTLGAYKHVSKKQGGNVLISPSSMFVSLTMLYAGARNDTESQIARVLKIDKMGRKQVLRQMEELVSLMKKENDSFTLSTANRLYPHVDQTILQEYLTLVSSHFKAAVKAMDFSTKTEEARKEINKWVEGETNGKIKDLLQSESLQSNKAMIVVNAIYFKGNWETQFDPLFTGKRNFTKLDSTATYVDMMNEELKEVKYGHDEELDCIALELPYRGLEMRMLVLLPRIIDGLPVLEKKLSVSEIRKLLSKMYTSTVDVSIPKFKLETSIKLKDTLSDFGMPDIFDAEKADLSGMGDVLCISDVYHKAYVDVNEEGTEAAAATATESCFGLEEKYFFVADHPFLFMIWDHRLDVPLFIGRFAEP